MGELAAFMLTIALVLLTALIVLFIVLAICLILLYKEIKKLRDTQDVIFNSAVKNEEYMATMAMNEGIFASQN